MMAEKKLGGYAGKILRVDLSHERLTDEKLDEETLRQYVGGNGIGVKYLYDEVKPSVEWSEPENRLMFFTGPLGGTKISGSGTFSAVTKGAMTTMGATSQANGYFGAFLKFAGYDGIIIQGCANRWVYLYIHDGTAELRDAQHLQGFDTWDTEDAVKKEIEGQSSVYTIGPAGENLIRFACIIGDHGHVIAHNGIGAVMGSKRLKAIATQRGHSAITVAKPERLAEIAQMLAQKASEKEPNLRDWGTAFILPFLHKGGLLPVKNYTTNIFNEAEKFGGQYLRTHYKATPTTCWACQMRHCAMIEVTEGPYTGYYAEEPEYESMAAMGPQIDVKDPGATIMICDQVNRLGMDSNESGWLIGWLMDCYDKGLMTKDNLDGIELNWGNVEGTVAILKKVAFRQGTGNLWAEGVKRSAETIGGEAQNLAIYTKKGGTPPTHDHRGMWQIFMDINFANTGTNESVGGGVLDPTEVGESPVKDMFDPTSVSTYLARMNGRSQFVDCLGVCTYAASDVKLNIEALNAITGWDFTVDEALTVGKRIVNLLRVFSFRNGLTKDIEEPSARYGSVPVDGPHQGKDIMLHWDSSRENYYQQMGWDPKTGKPLQETLERLGLGRIYHDLDT